MNRSASQTAFGRHSEDGVPKLRSRPVSRAKETLRWGWDGGFCEEVPTQPQGSVLGEFTHWSKELPPPEPPSIHCHSSVFLWHDGMRYPVPTSFGVLCSLSPPLHHTRSHMHTHAHIHAHMHTRMHTQCTRMHTHTHMQPCIVLARFYEAPQVLDLPIVLKSKVLASETLPFLSQSPSPTPAAEAQVACLLSCWKSVHAWGPHSKHEPPCAKCSGHWSIPEGFRCVCNFRRQVPGCPWASLGCDAHRHIPR